jgi:hypothetical protein
MIRRMKASKSGTAHLVQQDRFTDAAQSCQDHTLGMATVANAIKRYGNGFKDRVATG